MRDMKEAVMATNSRWRTGVTLAVTLAITYTVCALAYAVMPGPGISMHFIDR